MIVMDKKWFCFKHYLDHRYAIFFLLPSHEPARHKQVYRSKPLSAASNSFLRRKSKNPGFFTKKIINYCQKRGANRFTRVLGHKISSLPSRELQHNSERSEACPRVARVQLNAGKTPRGWGFCLG